MVAIVYIRTPHEQSLAAGILETPLIFGKANPDSSNPEASFLFSNPAYYALQRYVYNGMQLSKSRKVFEATYNKPQFNEAVGQPGVYNLTMKTFVGINSHCTSFWSNTVGQMTLFAENISLFGRTAGKVYTEMSRRLDIIASVPNNERSTNATWLSSIVDVNKHAERLQKQMEIAHNQSVQLLENINTFRAQTINDFSNLNQVDRLLNNSNVNVYKRVAEQNAEVQRLKAEADSAQSDYDSAAKRVSVGMYAYAWYWPIGTIVYFSLRPKWLAEMEAATERKKAGLAGLKDTEAKLQTFIQVTDDLKLLQLQTDSVLDYIEQAVNLLGNCTDAFSHMSASLSALKVELESEGHDTNPETIKPKWFSDESFRMSLMASAEHWENVYTEAAAFKGTAAIKIVPLKEAVQLYEQKAPTVYQALGLNANGANKREFLLPPMKW
ncbi:hypothetical protein Dda_8824 [Drechslerella dactyloides]|uniref:Uncharacterized protein n=1 Tax=Drechslerella dactyloides TaxID=74499 RepID=A0AAD6IQA1_DREDA|nr:hypothetical protein Dda_8824 [Drechslerella dactyloides]